MIISFYSYKGGVGRSQLCANVAAYLCHKKNKRVLLWDWDFEAPGLHYFFGKSNDDIDVDGTLEIFERYVALMRTIQSVKPSDLPGFDGTILTLAMSSGESTQGCIDLLPAGNYTKDFAYRANSFNWFEFYELLDGKVYLEVIKESLSGRGYDYILIDSRTGISDYSGICNIQLPDLNVVVMAANDQNFNGSLKVIKQIIQSEYTRQKYRRSLVMPILSRLDPSHPNFEAWIRKFSECFSFLLPLLDQNLSPEFSEEIFSDFYIAQTFLEYVPTYSAGENVFITSSKTTASRLSFIQKYINIAEAIETINSTGSLGIENQVDKDTWLFYADRAKNEGANEKAAVAYFLAGDDDKSIQVGSIPEAFLKKGNQCYLNGEKSLATEYYKKAIDLKPDYYQAYNNLALLCDTLSERDKAIELYKKAIEIKPDYFLAYTNLGLVFQGMGNLEEAMLHFKKALELNPMDCDNHYNIGLVHYWEKNYPEALKSFNQCLSIKHDHKHAFLQAAICYSNLGLRDESIFHCHKALEVDGEFSRAYASLGFMYIQFGEIEKAKKVLLQAIELGCYDPGYMNLGHYYLYEGDIDKALETYKAGLEKTGNDQQFFINFDDDFKYLRPYGIKENVYQEIRKHLQEQLINKISTNKAQS